MDYGISYRPPVLLSPIELISGSAGPCDDPIIPNVALEAANLFGKPTSLDPWHSLHIPGSGGFGFGNESTLPLSQPLSDQDTNHDIPPLTPISPILPPKIARLRKERQTRSSVEGLVTSLV